VFNIELKERERFALQQANQATWRLVLNAFQSLMEHQTVKENVTKQRLRAKCRF
jgi:hypothetical protein